MNKIIIAVVIAGCLVGNLFLVNHMNKKQSETLLSKVQNLIDKIEALGSTEFNRLTKVMPSTSVSCGTSSTLAIATTTERMGIDFINDSSSVIYLGLGVNAQGGQGIRINANGGNYPVEITNLFTGSIYCIASSTAALIVQEYK